MKKFLYNAKIAPYIFILPFLVIFTLFFLYPLINAAMMSFQKVLPGKSVFIGFENYLALLNPAFGKALLNSVIYTLLTLIVLIPIPLLLAIIVNNSNLVGTKIFKSVLFLPALTSVVVASMVFRFIFGELPTSQMNIISTFLGYESMKWLRNSKFVFPILVFVASWRWIGVNMLYFLSGLQSIPEEIIESSKVEGASSFQKYKYIIIPMLKPVLTYVITISIYGGLSMFTESLMIYGINSPNDMALTIIGYLYKLGIMQNNLGLASAVGMFLLCFALIINLIQLKSSGFFKKG